MKSVYTGNLGQKGEYPQSEVWGGLNSCNDVGTEPLKCYRVEKDAKIFPGYTALTLKGTSVKDNWARIQGF